MADISVNYLRLDLKSPIIAASSGYTADLEKIVALARSGAGAIVLKSLFEEQINNEISFLEESSADYTENAALLFCILNELHIFLYRIFRNIPFKKICILGVVCATFLQKTYLIVNLLLK